MTVGQVVAGGDGLSGFGSCDFRERKKGRGQNSVAFRLRVGVHGIVLLLRQAPLTG